MKSETSKKSNQSTIKGICFTAIMSALVFVFTYTFKIPLGNGYTHIGDSIIFLSIALIGSKKSSLAGGIGAGLADLIGGYAIWVIPTFIIKAGMALVCGLIAEKLFKNKTIGYIVGCIAGGVFHFIGYSIAWAIIFDWTTSVGNMITLALQTVVGFAIAIVFIAVFNKSGVTAKLQKLAQ